MGNSIYQLVTNEVKERIVQNLSDPNFKGDFVNKWIGIFEGHSHTLEQIYNKMQLSEATQKKVHDYLNATGDQKLYISSAATRLKTHAELGQQTSIAMHRSAKLQDVFNSSGFSNDRDKIKNNLINSKEDNDREYFNWSKIQEVANLNRETAIQKELQTCYFNIQKDLILFREALTGQKQMVAIQLKTSSGDMATIDMPLLTLYESDYLTTNIDSAGKVVIELRKSGLTALYNQYKNANSSEVKVKTFTGQGGQGDKFYERIKDFYSQQKILLYGDSDYVDAQVFELYSAYKDTIGGRSPQYTWRSTGHNDWTSFVIATAESLAEIDKWVNGLKGGDASSLVQSKSFFNSNNANSLATSWTILLQLRSIVSGLRRWQTDSPRATVINQIVTTIFPERFALNMYEDIVNEVKKNLPGLIT